MSKPQDIFLENINYIKEKIQEGYSYLMIATELNLNPLTVGRLCREYGIPSHCRQIQQRIDNVAKRPEIREKISNTVKQLWTDGIYDDRVNGMLDKTSINHHNFTGYKERYDKKYKFYNEGDLVCEICGKTIDESKIDIHHIDENHDHNLLSNLEALCVDCHREMHLESRRQPFMELTKCFEFDAGHYLPAHPGKCFFSHGHRYKLEITIKKRVDRRTGFVLDFGKFSKIVKEKIIDVLDHENINNYIFNPTSENIVIWIWLQLSKSLKGIECISLWESATGCCKITKDEMQKLVDNFDIEAEWFEQEVDEYNIKKS